MRYWKRVNTGGDTITVESYSHDLDIEGAVEITKRQFNEFLASLSVPEPEPPIIFDSPVGTGLPEKVEYIEQFLVKLYPKEVEQ